MVAVRREVRALEALDAGADVGARLQAAGDAFLEVERYVNLNVTAVRKLLKKHDKVLPERPCAAFYTARMHDMRWVRNDYSDVVVRLSRLYAARAPAAAPADGPRGVVDERSFVRATTKYWVRSDDLSAVKLAISRHLPVLVSGGRVTEGESKDSQLVNSVYLDSPSLELYHGRLAKLPGAVALRLRWYGTGEPEEVFVERKTHRDAWTGDASVKERFRVLPGDVPRLLRAEYEPPADLPAAERRLAREVQRLVSTKRLVPTVRSQCHRTAFQLAHTNAVRASIDTNLCLINEVQREDDDHAPEQGRWYRDAARSIPSSDLTRFPFAVLELKLALAEADDLPAWLRPVLACVETNQCGGCTRQFFTKSFLGDDAAVLARSSGEEPAVTRRKALISTQIHAPRKSGGARRGRRGAHVGRRRAGLRAGRRGVFEGHFCKAGPGTRRGAAAENGRRGDICRREVRLRVEWRGTGALRRRGLRAPRYKVDARRRHGRHARRPRLRRVVGPRVIGCGRTAVRGRGL